MRILLILMVVMALSGFMAEGRLPPDAPYIPGDEMAIIGDNVAHGVLMVIVQNPIKYGWLYPNGVLPGPPAMAYEFTDINLYCMQAIGGGDQVALAMYVGPALAAAPLVVGSATLPLAVPAGAPAWVTGNYAPGVIAFGGDTIYLAAFSNLPAPDGVCCYSDGITPITSFDQNNNVAAWPMFDNPFGALAAPPAAWTYSFYATYHPVNPLGLRIPEKQRQLINRGGM
jgi:hypothetical protein